MNYAQKVDNKIILIISSIYDQSTSDVIEWLLYYKSKIIRLNDNIIISIKDSVINGSQIDLTISLNDYTINLKDVSSFWYRRGFFRAGLNDNSKDKYHTYLLEEKTAINEFVINQLEKKAKISYFYNHEINKLLQLELAVKAGLQIPETMITNNKKDLSKFFLDGKSVITKSIQGQLVISDNNSNQNLYTNIFTIEDFNLLDNEFECTKFQKQIEKQFELRIFFLNNIFYSMAIFSQSNTKTSVDFRHYDNKKPNRKIPYSLPNEIQNKLKKLMNFLNLLSGSIDVIVDKDGRYIFLEVNPIGQFGMVSFPCNYNLEKIIAENLIV